jgi:hypothetical protein
MNRANAGFIGLGDQGAPRRDGAALINKLHIRPMVGPDQIRSIIPLSRNWPNIPPVDAYKSDMEGSMADDQHRVLDATSAGTGQDSPEARRHRARQDYVQDQLQQTRTTTDYAEELRKQAGTRIAAAQSSLAKRPRQADPIADTIGQYHTVERMLDERAFYPAHDQRTESPDYAKVHQQMTVADDKHCLVCGVQHSTLADADKNPFGAIQMETHHHTIEWALANAIDPAKFNLHIRPGLLHAAQRRAEEPGYAAVSALYKAFDTAYGADMSLDTIKAWVDHAADNLWVLCDVHHRHKFVGIHAITYPIWGPQDVVDGGLVAQEIDAAKSSKAPV